MLKIERNEKNKKDTRKEDIPDLWRRKHLFVEEDEPHTLCEEDCFFDVFICRCQMGFGLIILVNKSKAM